MLVSRVPPTHTQHVVRATKSSMNIFYLISSIYDEKHVVTSFNTPAPGIEADTQPVTSNDDGKTLLPQLIEFICIHTHNIMLLPMKFDDLSLCCAHICSIFRFGFSAKRYGEYRYPARRVYPYIVYHSKPNTWKINNTSENKMST